MGNKPRIRFKGFTEDWEQRKLGNLTQLITKGTTPKVKNIQNGINFIKVENISDDGVISINSYVSEEEHMNYLSRSILANNDILFSIAGTLGRTAIVKSHLLPANTNQALAIIRLNKSVDVEYINTFLKSNAIKTYIRKNPTVGAQPNLSLGQVSDLEINIPNYSEQKKISNLFSKFDLMITLHQCKLEKLKLTKKALLQKVFPKNGKHIPEIRFKGFTDAWEQRKLGDFTNQINTFVNPEDAKLPLWSLTAEAGLIEKSDRYERDFLVKKKDQFKRIETNTLVYNPMNITIGSIDIYTGLYPIAVSGYYVSIVYDKNIDTDFLKEVLLLPSSLKMYKNYATGSLIERQRVQYPTFSKLQLLLPNLDEQEAIGQLFKSLNLNITLHQRKLERLQEVKKGLLQKMFV